MDTWICDTCGESITKHSDGWVEWISFPDEENTGKRKGRGFRLVHASHASPIKSCQVGGTYERMGGKGLVMDRTLEHFIGPDGLMLLLSYILEEDVSNQQVLEMIKRIHIPGYEQVRSHINEAMSKGAFYPNLPEGYYSQSQIKATLDYLSDRQD